MQKLKVFVQLHILLFIYSLGAVCSKIAGTQSFLSVKFIIFYGFVLFGFVCYALFWQQILKKLPLVTAYANKAITVVWGLLWGMLVFKEKITVFNVVGALVIIFGIYMVVAADEH